MPQSVLATGKAKHIASTLHFKDSPLGSVKLSEAKTFISVLKAIQHHLLRSKSTRELFIKMARDFFFALPYDVQTRFTKPTDCDFYQYIFANWPTFGTFEPPPGVTAKTGLRWGCVTKGAYQGNEIYIVSSIVGSTESAVSNTLHFFSGKELTIFIGFSQSSPC